MIRPDSQGNRTQKKGVNENAYDRIHRKESLSNVLLFMYEFADALEDFLKLQEKGRYDG